MTQALRALCHPFSVSSKLLVSANDFSSDRGIDIIHDLEHDLERAYSLARNSDIVRNIELSRGLAHELLLARNRGTREIDNNLSSTMIQAIGLARDLASALDSSSEPCLRF